MFIIRPIKSSDLEGLMALLKVSGHGLTSLPKDEKIIANKILHSERSFEHRMDGPNGESYLFVMEEIFTGKLVGVSGLISKIGGFDPYYFYRLKTQKMYSKMLDVEKQIRTLHMEKIHSGPGEICSLFLAPDYRNSKNGRFLSLSRFLFMAEDRKFFEDTIIAEMRGKVNDQGHSPFWDAVGKKFMDIDFPKADYLTMKSKKFIEELLPDYPLIIDLLPKEAQDVVAKVHPNTEPAKYILEQEGFKFNGLVGIFEPGPVLEANLNNIRAFKESRVIEIESITNDNLDSETFIISTSQKENNFKSCLGKIKLKENNKGIIEAVTATALKLRVGEKIRFVTFKPQKGSSELEI